MKFHASSKFLFRFFCFAHRKRIAYFKTAEIFLSLLIIFCLFYLVSCYFPKLIKNTSINSVGMRSNEFISNLTITINDSSWKDIIEFLDFDLDSINIRPKVTNNENRIKMDDFLSWIYRNFFFLISFSWFTSIKKELGKWINISKAEIEKIFNNSREKINSMMVEMQKSLVLFQSLELLSLR